MSSFSSPTNSSLNNSESRECWDLPVTVVTDALFHFTKVLLLFPLVVYILYLAYQRWKQQGSLAAASHCDVFTYHLSVMELFTVLGTVFLVIGSYNKAMQIVAVCLLSFTYCGESFFHVLTCVERYLAVVHPHTYMGLKNARGIRIRNVAIGCVWLLCILWMGVTDLLYPAIPTHFVLAIMIVWIVIISFFSISVLVVLIQSKPGERKQGKGGVDKSKQRAFRTITIILVVLCLWVGGFITVQFLDISTPQSSHVSCVVTQICLWVNIPSSLVLPLLYLQRAGKFPFCRHANEKK